jgi:hypothetical protein
MQEEDREHQMPEAEQGAELEEDRKPEEAAEFEDARKPEETDVARRRLFTYPIETDILVKRCRQYRSLPSKVRPSLVTATVNQLNALGIPDAVRWSNKRVVKWFNNNKDLRHPVAGSKFHGRDRFRFRPGSGRSTVWGQSTGPESHAEDEIGSHNQSHPPMPDVVQPHAAPPANDAQAPPSNNAQALHPALPDVPPTGYMFIEVVPWDGRNSCRTTARVGLKNDRLDTRAFMLNCPSNWLARFGNYVGHEGPWDHVLRIFTTREEYDEKRNPIFTIYFGSNFTEQVIYSSYDANEKCLQQFTAFDGTFTVFLFPTRYNATSYISANNDHPFNVFSHSLLDGRRNIRPDPSVIQGLNEDVMENINKRLLRDQAAGDLLQAIVALSRHGHHPDHVLRSMVTITASISPSIKMVKLPDGKGVFRIVWVFPHAVDMLNGSPRPACVLLDGTFSILKPVCFFY